MQARNFESYCAVALAVLLLGGTPTAAEEPTPAGSPPDLTQGGKFERADFYYHLGPTGAQGQMYVKNFMTGEARQILITKIDEGSPAEGVLEPGDVILGIGQKRFDKDARKTFGWAIEEAEKEENKGVLKLLRWRDGKEKVVSLQLRVMGSFSDTAPYDCPKSKKILEDAMKVLVERKDWGRFASRALAFLATGEDQYIKLVRDMLHEAKWAGPDAKLSVESGGLVAWGAGYRGVLLTEYYLATGDKYVLPAIREHAVKTAMGQSNGGTWGHGFAWTRHNDGRLHGRLGGYGALNQAGLPCFLSLILAKKCGIEHPEIDDAIMRASRFFSKFVGNGSIGYGFHRPTLEINANGRNGMSGNGKNGIAAVAFGLLGRREPTQFFSKLTASLYNTCEYGHSGNSYSYFWDPLGANCGGPETAAAFLKELRWYYALTRKPDGSFVYQPLAGYYGRGVLDPTVAQVLIATLPRRAIYLTGKDQDKSFWLGKKGAEEAVAAGRWRLADTDDMSAEDLIAELDDWSPIAREWIAKALGKKDGSFTVQLMELLKSDKPEARAGACAALGYQGERAADAVPLISKALTDEEQIVRIAASYALARIDKPARKAVPDMLRAVLVAQEEGLMHPGQQAMAYSLGYANSYHAPLYFDGILPKYAEGENPLEGLDRDLLYASVAKLMKSPSGRVRGCGVYVLRFFTKEDTAAMAQPICNVIKVPAPNYVMFDDLPRQYGLDLLAKHRIEEGLDLCWQTLDERWGKGVRFQHRCQTLRKYAGNARPFLPRLKKMRWTTKSPEDRQLLEDTIRAIEEDRNPQPLVSLQALVDRRLAKDLHLASISDKDDKKRVRLCRELMNNNTEDYFYQAAGLRQLVAMLRADAFGDILAALGHPDERLHVAAVKLGAELPGKKATRKWVAQLSKAKGKRLAGILAILAARGDPKNLTVLRKHLKHEDEAVRAAAIDGIGVLGGEKELPLLIGLLVTAEGEQERAAAENALVTTCRNGKNVEKSISPVLAALPEGTTPARCSLIRVLGQVGGARALAAVSAATGDEDAEVSKTSLDALSTSPDPKATDVLMALAENPPSPKLKSPAVTACLRRVIIEPVSAGQKTDFLKKLLVLDERGRNARNVLSELPWSPSIDSLRLAQSCLHRKGLIEPAAAAAVAIAERMNMSDQKQRDAAVEVLKEVLEATKDENTTALAKALIVKHGG